MPQFVRNRRNPYFRTALVVGFVVAALATSALAVEDMRPAYRAARDRYTDQLEDLATLCDERRLTEEAFLTRLAIGPRSADRVCLPELPKLVGPPPPPPEATVDQIEWREEFHAIGAEYADTLSRLVRDAVRNRQPLLAHQMAIDGLRANPDQPALRKALGYVAYEGRWCTAYEVKKLRSGLVDHEIYGWLPAKFVPRYEQGERYHRGHWISAQEDARVHQDIRSGWLVETEHYTIHTNHSLEAGVALGRRLEQVHYVWSQLFIRFYMSEAQIAATYGGRPSRASLPRHEVVYFRDKQNYIETLSGRVPNVEISAGFYTSNTQKAYFYAADSEEARETLVHEATHQLFHEVRTPSPRAGRNANFWIIEGIAMYMESLRTEDGCFVLGGLEHSVRLQNAWFRFSDEGFYIPWGILVAYNGERLHHDPDIAKIYGQAAAMTHFLIHYDDGRYRDSLMKLLVAVYSGRDNAQTLSNLLRVPYTTLDRQFQEYLRSFDARMVDPGE